jgi:hypothetical protein
MCTDFPNLAVKAAMLMAGTWLLLAQGVRADPVSSPGVAAITSSKEQLAAAIRTTESERSATDALDFDPVREAANASKATADRRAALTALGVGVLPQQKQAAINQSQGQVGTAPTAAQRPRDGAPGAQQPAEADPIKEAVRPLYEDISKSSLADTVRTLNSSLKAELLPEKEKPADGAAGAVDPSQQGKTKEKEKEKENDAAGAGNSSWSGGADRNDFNALSRSGSPSKQDPAVAAALTAKLIDELKPWALGFMILLLMGLSWKTMMGFLRSAGQRRRKRRFSQSTQPRRTQY